MTELVKALREELASLEAQLRADPRFVKIEHIKALLGAYDAPVAAPKHFAPAYTVPTRAGTKGGRVREEIASFLRAHGSAKRANILKHLTDAGIMGHEEKPMKQLSNYLTRFPEFVSNGDGNWRMRKTSDMTGPSGDAPEGGHQTAAQ